MIDILLASVLMMAIISFIVEIVVNKNERLVFYFSVIVLIGVIVIYRIIFKGE